MERTGRRGFLLKAGVAGLGLTGLRSLSAAEQAARRPPIGLGIPATEELMREHAVIQRLLLVFDECANRLTRGVQVSGGVLLNAGAIVDQFVEAYHEELEERRLFPLLEKAPALAPLVAVLRRQHAAGRGLAERIMFFAGRGEQITEDVRDPLVTICRLYTRMYRAHAAHEDTVLSMALRRVLEPHEFATLGERFRDIAAETLGSKGLTGVLAQVTEIEKTLGVAELDYWTA